MSEADDVVMPSDVAEVGPEAEGVESVPMGGGTEESSSRSILSPLLSTEPDVSPREASGAFDPEVPWHKDLECALQKITGSGGMPAIGHLLVAGGKLAMGQDVSMPSVPGGGNGGGSDDSTDSDPDVIGGDEW